MPDPAPQRLEVGRVGRPHGLKGDVTALLVTDRAERTEPGSVLYADDREVVVETARPNKGGWVIHFAGVNDLQAAEALRGSTLSAAPLDDEDGDGDDTIWVHDLIGCEVRDGHGVALGIVIAVDANPAHDLLVLDTGPLLPMPFVVEHTAGHIVVNLPEGLLDL
jgi:16S rRNA processing protein RimM